MTNTPNVLDAQRDILNALSGLIGTQYTTSRRNLLLIPGATERMVDACIAGYQIRFTEADRFQVVK